MHSSHMLDEEILPVEVVWLAIAILAHVASPKPHAHVLRVDVALPFVLGAECGGAAVDTQRTRK